MIKELLPCPHCGGKPKWMSLDGKCYYITCETCGARTVIDLDKKYLADKWNKRYVPIVKVENIKTEWGDDEYVNDRMGDMYYYGDCGNCGETVSHNQKYCSHCGARLEWE